MHDNGNRDNCNNRCNPDCDNNVPSQTGRPMQPDIFECISPEEIVLIAGIFAISLAKELSDDNATSLAFFLSTTGSNIGLFVDRRARERGAPIPEVPGVG